MANKPTGTILRPNAPLSWLCRLLLASVFLWAAIGKIMDGQEFALSVAAYRLLPSIFIGPMAAILPWLEIYGSLASLLGPRHFRLAGLYILAALLAVFMLAAAQGLIRGLDFDCGCFGSSDGQASQKPGAAFFLRDIGLMALALFSLAQEKMASRTSPQSSSGKVPPNLTASGP
jgi:hypothetical protein